jgi:hypothetical protein
MRRLMGRGRRSGTPFSSPSKHCRIPPPPPPSSPPLFTPPMINTRIRYTFLRNIYLDAAGAETLCFLWKHPALSSYAYHLLY